MPYCTLKYKAILPQKLKGLLASEIQFSRRLVGSTFYTQHCVSVTDCMTECEKRTVCRSINYKRSTHTCELNDEVADSDLSLEEKRGYVYNALQDMNECQCDQFERCNSDGSCRPDRCPHLRAPDTSISPSGNVNYLGSKAYISWLDNTALFPYVSRAITFKCTAGGTWEEDFTSRLNDVNGSCMRVFRADSTTGGDVYKTWSIGVNSSPDIHCFDPGSCPGLSYRKTVIDDWPNLNISTVRFSVYKQGVEVKYIVSNGTDSDSTNWFSQERIIKSSWTSLLSSTYNYFSLHGAVFADGGLRRFFLSKNYGGCNSDKLWFSASTHDRCPYEAEVQTPPFTKVALLYSTTSEPEIAADPTKVSKADTIAVAVCT